MPDGTQLAPEEGILISDSAAKRIGQSWINMVTGADLSPDGRRLIISTYGPSYELTRTGDETWADVFKKQPRRIDMPRRRQGESICYDTDGESLLLTSEKRFPEAYSRLWTQE